MHMRLKTARKALGLTQSDFGKKLGVTDGAISRLERAERGITEQMLVSICREFPISEDWLLTGDGDMFVENDDTIIAALVTEYGLDDLDKKILEAYVELPEKTRAAVNTFFTWIAASIMEENIDTARIGVFDMIDNSNAPCVVKADMQSSASAIFSKAFPFFGVGNVDLEEPLVESDIEAEADAIAEMARQQFLKEKKRESEAFSSGKSITG